MDWFGIILFMIIYYIVDRYFKKKELPVWKRELFSFIGTMFIAFLIVLLLQLIPSRH
mgnify:CR=1 FL=1